MPRIPRLLLLGESATYHVISRTALPGFVLGDVEKEHLVQLLRSLCGAYFASALGFCVMGNHLHLLVRMHTGEDFSDEEIRRRFRLYYGADPKRELAAGQIPALRLGPAVCTANSPQSLPRRRPIPLRHALYFLRPTPPGTLPPFPPPPGRAQLAAPLGSRIIGLSLRSLISHGCLPVAHGD